MAGLSMPMGTCIMSLSFLLVHSANYAFLSLNQAVSGWTVHSFMIFNHSFMLLERSFGLWRSARTLSENLLFENLLSEPSEARKGSACTQMTDRLANQARRSRQRISLSPPVYGERLVVQSFIAMRALREG
ncbi:hypothetical protein EDD37DRAFT_191925 [Exophiala viscosa]|uniref:uncharacterized protein n=1 Tax=Exophiala viscosa TaxID=2486360 RepID=UPI002194A14D|nr:hypothetical protein EDD37DRAFT_191925 [Exophiala viscosa]